MSVQSVFDIMARAVREKGVSCLLIGGFAVNFYKVTRQTADVDFLMTKEDFEKVMPYFYKAGYQSDLVHENFAQLKNTGSSFMDMDVMFVDRSTRDRLFKESCLVPIARHEFWIPSLEHLIALKLHSVKHNPKNRLIKDLPDIVSLIKWNDVDVTKDRFRELCFRYGTEDLYRKIVEAV